MDNSKRSRADRETIKGQIYELVQEMYDVMEIVKACAAESATVILGAVYDESRRNRMLLVPPEDVQRTAAARSKDGWHAYEIRCEGRRARLAINGVQTADYTEADESIPLDGMVALQIHGGLVGTIRYRNIRIEELPPAGGR